jgi:hypothetical protein
MNRLKLPDNDCLNKLINSVSESTHPIYTKVYDNSLIKFDNLDNIEIINLIRESIKLVPTCDDNINNLLSSDLFNPHKNIIKNLKREAFEPIVGSVLINQKFNNKYLKEYYSKLTLNPYDSGLCETRSGEYYSHLYVNLDDISKYQIIKENLLDSMKILLEIDKKSLDDNDYLAYLGLLDHIRNYALIIFEVFIMPEKALLEISDSRYYQNREYLIQFVKHTIESFYLALLGKENKNELLYIQQNHKSALEIMDSILSRIDFSKCRIREVDHPLILLCHAYRTIQHNITIEALIGLPSGGTEVPFIINLIKKLYFDSNENVKIYLIPYSRNVLSHRLTVDNSVLDNVKDLKKNAHILITEDNSNTGQTLYDVISLLKGSGYKNVRFSLIEWDPIRVIAKIKSKKDITSVTNTLNLDLINTVAGIVPIYVDNNYNTSQMRRLYIRNRLPIG